MMALLGFQSLCSLLIYADVVHGLLDSRIALHQMASQPNMSHTLAQDESRVISLNSRLRADNLMPLKPGLSIGSGNYYVEIGIGTPPKYFPMLLDTGSSFSWLQCLPCQNCHPQAEPVFDPHASSTYKNLSCSSSACASLRGATLNDPECDFSTGACIYTASYGDRSFSVGVLSQDVLTLSPSRTLAPFLYGCGSDNMGLFGEAAGLLGLGRHRLSVITQMSGKHGSVFSYCLPSYGSLSAPSGLGGFLSVGKMTAGSFKYTPMIRNSAEPSLYFLKLTSIAVGGKSLSVTPAEYEAPGIIDSGTVISRLPVAVYNNLKQDFTESMITQFKYKQAPATSILDTCFITSSGAAAPLVRMVFAGGAELSLGPPSALIEVADGVSCLAFASSETAGGVAIIGNHQQQTFEVVYDVIMSRIGFSPNACT